MKEEIFVPLLSWLIGASRIGGNYNTYVGSRGTDPAQGCFGRKIFNYRIWIERIGEDDEEEELLKAAVYYGLKAYENCGEEEIETTVYELEEESREKIRQWLTEKMNAYLD
ncbi:MAG: hypothetical protein PUB43_08775 [Oscillospiraceae bacterium]|nr:hypothetical protein [Oscillospiraceae bacterium]